MIEVNLEIYAIALFMLLIVEVVSIIAILWKLRTSDIPLGMVKIYTLYFVSGLCGWIISGLSSASEKYINLSGGGFFYIVCGYLLLMAVSNGRCHPVLQRIVLIISIITAFITFSESSTINQLLIISFFGFFIYAPITYHSFVNMRKERNLGHSMITVAVFAHLIISLLQVYLITISKNPSFAHSLALINSSSGYLLVGIGFIASMLFREHQILISQALRDPLTNLFNRRGMEYSLGMILPTMSGTKNCISAIVLDIDHFKKINDTYGHDGGDEVLKIFAKEIDKNHRDKDVCTRLGGEEFAFILPWTTSSQAQKMAENLREKIQSLEIKFNGSEISVTSSFGVATQCSDIEIEELLNQADKALYTAKNSGRNRVCVSNNES